MAIKIVPKLRPFHSGTASFADGSDNPRDFLERCIEAIAAYEAAVGAFVVTNLDAAREAADGSTARWAEGTQLSQIEIVVSSFNKFLSS